MPNEEQDAVGDIPDESFDASAMNSSAKEFLTAAIGDYNDFFKTNFSVDSNGFQNYYRDLAQRVKSREIDLLIVVDTINLPSLAQTLPASIQFLLIKNLTLPWFDTGTFTYNAVLDATKTLVILLFSEGFRKSDCRCDHTLW